MDRQIDQAKDNIRSYTIKRLKEEELKASEEVQQLESVINYTENEDESLVLKQ